jgi:tetratricopeptide (TPR) repeat protein
MSGQALYLRGAAMLRAGQAQAALPVLMQAVNNGCEHFEAILALGQAMLRNGRASEASGILSHAARLRPDSAEAHRELGAAFDQQTLHDQAIAAYRRAVELAPKLGDIHLRLAQLYAAYSLMEEASESLDRAAALNPKSTAARMFRSDAALLRGDIPAAEDWARKAVQVEPDNSAAQGGLGGILYNQGRFEEASRHFESALRLNPRLAKCWDGLAHCRRFGQEDGAMVERMRSALRRPDLAEPDRMTIHFALGKVLDDRGDYAGAMEQFDAANRLRARGLHLDRASIIALVDRNIRAVQPDFYGRFAGLASDSEKPVFIVGMYRSGTTLVEQILSSHPTVAAGGELTVWSPVELEVNEATGGLVTEDPAASVAKYLGVLERVGAGAARVTDKMPANMFRLGAIHALFPRARIIHCERDPIDTCLSMYTNHFNTRMPFVARKDDLVFYYQQYQRMMAHWRAVLPEGAMLEVEYERLVAEPEAETRRMVAFAGLEWDDACLRPEANTRPIATSSAWQARQPVYATSARRWRRYEPWLGELRRLLPAEG